MARVPTAIALTAAPSPQRARDRWYRFGAPRTLSGSQPIGPGPIIGRPLAREIGPLGLCVDGRISEVTPRSHRGALIERLADLVLARASTQASLVAVDGPDASGKTTLANELADVIATRRRPVARVEADSFLNPRAIRYRRGPDSAPGVPRRQLRLRRVDAPRPAAGYFG
jgi:hypothetical protein